MKRVRIMKKKLYSKDPKTEKGKSIRNRERGESTAKKA
jgi:hypothetical protein